MKLLIIVLLASFWAEVTNAIWGFYPVTIGTGLLGAFVGALAVYVFEWADPDREPDEMEHLPNDPPVKSEPRQVLCWDGCGKIMPFPEVICPECREKYPWMSQE